MVNLGKTSHKVSVSKISFHIIYREIVTEIMYISHIYFILKTPKLSYIYIK